MSKKLERKPEPAGRTVYVCGSKFSKSFTGRAAEDFRAGKVNEAGQIVLPDGQIIRAGPTYETMTSPALLQLIKDGTLQASIFGKLAKRGGKTCPEQKDTSTIPQPQ
jgi:hypothetical protein